VARGLRGRLDAGEARKRLERQAFFEQAAALTPYVAVEKGSELIFLPTADRGIALEVFVKSGSRNDMKVLGRAVRSLERAGIAKPPEPVFVDVGANIGTTIVTALRRRGFATGVALEPSAENFRTLRLNLVANDLDDRVQALQVAASESEGQLPLELSPLSSGCHRIARGSDGAVMTEALTLDGLVARGVVDPGRVGLLWMDTQGHEPSVLKGASKLLEAGVPLVTAVRNQEGWDAVKRDLSTILPPHYSDVQNLRKDDHPRRISELPTVLDHVKGNADLLLFRR
jgi:FkbM family methyltransferase